MAVGDALVFPGFLTPVLTQLFFPKPLTTFLTCFWRGKRGKYTRKSSPQSGIKLTTTKSWVRHTHCWATRVGLVNRGFDQSAKSIDLGHQLPFVQADLDGNFLLAVKVLHIKRTCILRFICLLTLYHIIPTFKNPEEKAFWKHCGKRRKW